MTGAVLSLEVFDPKPCRSQARRQDPVAADEDDNVHVIDSDAELDPALVSDVELLEGDGLAAGSDEGSDHSDALSLMPSSESAAGEDVPGLPEEDEADEGRPQ